MAFFTESFENSGLLFGGGRKRGKDKEVDVDADPPTQLARWTPPRVQGLDQWVQKILDITMPETRRWKEMAPKYGWKPKNHGLPQGSVTCPEVDILADPMKAARLLQSAFTRSGALRSTSGGGSSSWSPQLENKQPKKRRSFSTGDKNKKIKTATTELVFSNMVIDDDVEVSDEKASFQRKQRSSSAQPNAQSGELSEPTDEEVQAPWGEMDRVDNANSRFPVSVAISGPRSSDPGPLLPSVDEQPIISAAPIEASSQPSTPITSRPFTSIVPSPLALSASPPPATNTREEGASPSPVELANYLKPPASEKDKKKIQSFPEECMLNNAMHNAEALLAKRDKLDARLLGLEAKAAKANELEDRLQLSEQEVMALSQEATKLNAASVERVNNLEAILRSKAEDTAAAEEKRVRMEERFKKIMEQYWIHISTICDLDSSLSTLRPERDGLQAEVCRLKSKLQFQGDSLVFEKTYAMYHMKRKTLEEAKAVIVDIDDCIAKARALELSARECLPAQPTATDSSRI
ncbi:uncharacterized protein [Nicotiana tomentosiformis]|uniref:uncharacterized protein n=1 Tax=Nicotiana tomentosiformis TaxID=4098 RepID=UPI00388CDE3D